MFRPRTNDGFTLLEVLIAAAVFAVGLAALIPLVVNQTRGNEDAGARTEAVAFAQEKIEELRALPYAALTAGNDTSPDGVFTRQWVFLPVNLLAGDTDAVTGDADLSRVGVTVTWTPPRGGARSFTLITSRARY